MKAQKCPHCGSSHTTRSPSGRHLLCLDCHRILVQPRTKKPRGRRLGTGPSGPETSFFPESTS